MTVPLLDVPATVSEPASPAICGGRRFRDTPARGQLWTEARSIDDLVGPQDQVRALSEIVDLLDVSEFEADYSGGGAPAYPPRYVLKLIFFGMTIGVRSGHELARRCENDKRFMWLAAGEPLDHELFTDFRKRFREPLKRLFRQTVLLGVAAGLITMRQLSIDGTKIAAHAKRKTLSQADIAQLLAKLDKRIEELLDEADSLDAAEEAEGNRRRAVEIPAELADAQRRRDRLLEAQAVLSARGWERVSETDLEAPLQKTQDGKRPGYNGQVAVDADSGMPVAVELTDAQNDTQQLPPTLDAAVANTGFKPDVVAADTGYQSKDALQHLEQLGVNGYINQAVAESDGRFGHDEFTYDGERDLYICPAGHELLFKGFKKLRYDDCRVYRSSSRCCKQCPQRAQCLSEKANCRQLVLAPHGELVTAMRRKLETEEGQAALKRRFGSVEPMFGTLKAVLGLRQFLTVGKANAAAELTLAAMAINLRKLVKWLCADGDLAQLGRVQATA